MSTETLRDLLVEELKDMYDAEHRLTKAIPKLVKAAESDELVRAFEDHLKQTEEHVTRLESVFESLGETPRRKSCKAMVGLLEEGHELMTEEAPPNLKDLMLIAAAQKVEHYEIATYGCLRAWAHLLNEGEAVRLLQSTLDEEAAADKKLTGIAEGINPEVSEEDVEMVGHKATSSGRRNGGRKTAAPKPGSRRGTTDTAE